MGGKLLSATQLPLPYISALRRVVRPIVLFLGESPKLSHRLSFYKFSNKISARGEESIRMEKKARNTRSPGRSG